MTGPVSFIVGAFIGGVFGLGSAAIAAKLAYKTAERKRIDDLRAAEKKRKEWTIFVLPKTNEPINCFRQH